MEKNLTAAGHDAEAIKIRAEAEAYAIERVKEELTARYIDFSRIQKWNGALPKFTGGGVIPFLDLASLEK